VGKSPKKQSEGVRSLLIWHSKYSAILSNMHSYRLTDFAHWEGPTTYNFYNFSFTRDHLEREIHRTEKEYQRTNQALFTYESIGKTFKQLLTQYTQLTTEIDNKKWALSELNKDK